MDNLKEYIETRLVDHFGNHERWKPFPIGEIGYNDYNPPNYGLLVGERPKSTSMPFKVGFVGNSSGEYDRGLATDIIYFAVMEFVKHVPLGTVPVIVSGLTNLGIPGDVYRITKDYSPSLKVVGIACSKASEYECYPVDEKHIIGNEWGDESEFFIDYIDALVRVGGGKQSHKEVAMFKEKYPNKLLIEFDL